MRLFRWYRCYKRCSALLIIPMLLLLVVAALPGSQAHAAPATFVGPKQHYLALGDSMAFGYQPDLDFDHGYVDDFGQDLEQRYHVLDYANLSCPGETTTSMIDGGCPYPFLRKYFYLDTQLQAALRYLTTFRGEVSPVTLNIGVNNVLFDADPSTCSVNQSQFNADLSTMDSDLTGTILPELKAAMTVNGVMTGDLIMIGYYDPYENLCPNSLTYAEELNQHLRQDSQGYGPMIDSLAAFGGTAVPNPHICAYTWICSVFHDFHATDLGHRVVANAIESTMGY
jgi:lysophospholipase L1-like esterase